MKTIDPNHWKRKSHFDFFRGMDFPHFNLSFNFNITASKAYAKEKELSFFKILLYISTLSANRIPELKTRIRGDEVVAHDLIHPAFTALNEDELFNFCSVEFSDLPQRFFKEVDRNTEAAQKSSRLQSDQSGRDDVIYITCIPWLQFTSLQHPVNLDKNDSVPRLSWGKYFMQDRNWMLPYSLQAHHGLADGFHAGRFFEIMQEILNAPHKYLE